MATNFLSPEMMALDHNVHHDLESFFGVLWVVCVNMNGPFYMHCCWQDEKSSSKKNPAQSPNTSTTAATSSSILTNSSISDVSSISYISRISNSSATTMEVRGSLAHIASPWTTITIPSELPQTHAPLPTPNTAQELFQSPASSLQRQDTFQEQLWCELEEIINVTTCLPLGEEEPKKHAPPIWTTPGQAGQHNLGPLDVFCSKCTIPETLFLD